MVGRKNVILFLSALLLTLGSGNAMSQTISDVTFGLAGNELTIYYGLDKSCDIRVRVSVDRGKTFSQPVQNLSGDVGKNVTPGKARKIIAYDMQEIRGVDSSDLAFIVEVDDGSEVIALFDSIVFKMMPVEGGRFRMGCTKPHGGKHSYDDEYPVHEVEVSSFYMGRYEVTQQIWKAVMGENPSRWQDNDSLPVEQVSWNDVQLFIARLSQITGHRFRLPTEAEWEYAARGGVKGHDYVFPGTEADLGNYCWYGSNASNRTHPVGQKRPNELGLYDMGGNVQEWCSDWMSEYTEAPQSNPRGPKHGENRILRGGCINSPSWGCRVSDRSWYLPDHGYGFHGFRLVMDPDEN